MGKAACENFSVVLKLRRKYQSKLKKECMSKDWIGYLFRGSYKTRFEICKDLDDEVVYVRPIQKHSGGMVMQPELMNYLLIPHRW